VEQIPLNDFNSDRYGNLCLNDTDGLRRRFMAILVASFHPLRILDAGCASGQLTREIISACPRAQVIGADASPECAQAIRSTLGIGAFTCRLGEEPIGAADGFFDVVHASEIIEHVFYTENMLREFHRVTCRGGRLLLSTPNLASWFNRIFIMFGYQPIWTETGIETTNDGNPLRKPGGPPAGHIRSFTLSSLKAILERTGWTVESVQGQSLFSNRFRPLDSLISKAFPSLAADMVIVAVKK
jgi:SAM-dependent methyltransferase